MKKIGMMFFFIGFGLFAMAQNEKKEIETLSTEPTYVGDQEAMMKHIASNIKYPEVAVKNDVQGTVYTALTINEDGKIIDIRVLRGVSEELDLEAIRMIKSMPLWNPGTDADGNPITARVTLPIKFTLN